MKKITVLDSDISFYEARNIEFISLTDIARYQDDKRTDYIIQNWIRNRNTIEFLGIWESLNNPDFNHIEFDGFRKSAGLHSFSLTPSRWIESTGAIGLVSKRGRYGGTFAHKDIALEFSSWISVEFKLYMIKEFQRLKRNEMENIPWDIRRYIAKINYRIHTDAIKNNLIPKRLSKPEIEIVYASEADILNMALFGMTARQWRKRNPKAKGNIRDQATMEQLVCLSNLENLNAWFINEGKPQDERLSRLNEIAIHQMEILQHIRGQELLKE